MIGLDTNVLVRYIVQDDAAQALVASRLIETRCSTDDPGFIALIVMAELVWVLERAYGYAREGIAAVLRRLLSVAELRIEQSDLARSAVAAYERSRADFADHLIGLIHDGQGCKSTATFDKRATGTGLHRLLRS